MYKEILKSFLLLVLAKAWCKLLLGIPSFPLGSRNTKVSCQTWYPHLWCLVVWSFSHWMRTISKWTDVQSSKIHTWHKGLGAFMDLCQLPLKQALQVGLEKLWNAPGSDVSPLWFFSTISLPTPCRSQSKSSSSSACVSCERWGAINSSQNYKFL